MKLNWYQIRMSTRRNLDLLKQSGLMSLSSHRPRYRVSSISIRNDLFHRRNRLGRQWPHTSRFCVPHPFFSRGTIKDLYPIVGGGMIACVAGMFVDELEELLPPGVIGVGKQLFSERFQVINAYRLDVLLDRFASILVDLFSIR